MDRDLNPPRLRGLVRTFFATDAASGLILAGAAVFALIVANSSFGPHYFAFLHRDLAGMSVLHWVNDGLMAIFFLLIGLEVKRELVIGALSITAQRVLPGAAALAGMAVPALLYLAVARSDPAAAQGWAIPAATDIAFALAVVALLGKRVPPSLRIFLTAVAIIDDLGAIVIIALFYTTKIDLAALAAAGASLAILVGMNRARVTHLAPYLIIGAIIWYCVRTSGVHATLAGVVVAMTIPLRPVAGGGVSPLHRLERALHPLIGFVVVPIFGFANAGVSFGGVRAADLAAPIPLAIVAGLLIGKQAGVFGSVWLMCRAGFAVLPDGASWRQFYGVCVLCGIGFTMSLFIAGLAFGDGTAGNDAAKIGILIASVAAAAVGYFILATTEKK